MSSLDCISKKYAYIFLLYWGQILGFYKKLYSHSWRITPQNGLRCSYKGYQYKYMNEAELQQMERYN